MCSWKKKRVRKSGESRSVSVFWAGLFEEKRILGGGGGVESLGDGVVSGGRVQEGTKIWGEKKQKQGKWN